MEAREAASLPRPPLAVCSCTTHGPSCALKFRGRPLDLVFPTRLGLWFSTWIDLPAAWRATGVQGAFNPGPATAKAGPPPRPDSYFPRVVLIESRSIMASTPRPAFNMSSWTSKLDPFSAVRRGRWVSTAGRTRTVQARRNLSLNPVNDPAKPRGFTFHRMATLP